LVLLYHERKMGTVDWSATPEASVAGGPSEVSLSEGS
jgi:hypothetical protein